MTTLAVAMIGGGLLLVAIGCGMAGTAVSPRAPESRAPLGMLIFFLGALLAGVGAAILPPSCCVTG